MNKKNQEAIELPQGKAIGMNSLTRKEYDHIHSWLRYYHGKAYKCENISCSGKGKRFGYALLKGKIYEKVRENFIMLCGSCHGIYDTTQAKRQKLRDAYLGKKASDETKRRMRETRKKYRKPVVQLTKDGQTVAIHESITTAAKAVGAQVSNVSWCAARQQPKTVYGYIFKYYEKR